MGNLGGEKCEARGERHLSRRQGAPPRETRRDEGKHHERCEAAAAHRILGSDRRCCGAGRIGRGERWLRSIGRLRTMEASVGVAQ